MSIETLSERAVAKKLMLLRDLMRDCERARTLCWRSVAANGILALSSTLIEASGYTPNQLSPLLVPGIFSFLTIASMGLGEATNEWQNHLYSELNHYKRYIEQLHPVRSKTLTKTPAIS